MLVCGIDPGKQGAIAFLNDGNVVEIYDMPLIGKEIDKKKLLEITGSYNIVDITILERQHIMQKQKGQHAIGINFGYLEMALVIHNRAYEIISPQKWKRYFNLLKKEKSDSVNLAIQYFPDAEFYTKRGRLLDGRAEACLMALYMFEKRNKLLLTTEQE